MRWLKRDMGKVGIAFTGLQLFLVLIVWVSVMAASTSARASGLAVSGLVQTMPTVDTTVTALNKEKLALDVTKEKSDIFWSWTAMGRLLLALLELRSPSSNF